MYGFDKFFINICKGKSVNKYRRIHFSKKKKKIENNNEYILKCLHCACLNCTIHKIVGSTNISIQAFNFNFMLINRHFVYFK